MRKILFSTKAIKETANEFYSTAEEKQQFFLKEVENAKTYYNKIKTQPLPKALQDEFCFIYHDLYSFEYDMFIKDLNKEIKDLSFFIDIEKGIQNALSKKTKIEKVKALKHLKSDCFFWGLIDLNKENIQHSEQAQNQIDKIIKQVKENGTAKAPTPKTEKIQWLGTKNALPTLLNELLAQGLIDTTKANIQRLILNNFVDAENKPFSASYVKDVSKPSKQRLNKEVAQFVAKMAESLKK